MTKTKRVITLILCLALCFTVGGELLAALTVTAKAETVEYSNVLDDLSHDKNFYKALYPEISYEEYISLKNDDDPDNDVNLITVIQISESKSGEFFIYTYQPLNNSHDITANKIGMYLGEDTAYPDLNDSSTPKYSLKCVSQEGVFNKYLVLGITIPDETYHYYNLVEIERPFDEKLDEKIGDETILISKAETIGQRWCSYYLNNDLMYQMTTLDVVSITPTLTDFLYCENGITWGTLVGISSSCNAHYIAFNIDNFDVSKIYDASLEYYKRDVETTHTHAEGIWPIIYEIFGGNSDTTSTFYPNGGKYERVPVELSYKDEPVVFTGEGLWGHTYSWNRIMKASDFLSQIEDQGAQFGEKEREILNNSDYVFAFAETPVSKTISSAGTVGFTTTVVTGTEVSDVDILRLHFESKGRTYNLGVVGDVTKADDKPGAVLGAQLPDFSDLFDWTKKIFTIISIVLLCVLLLFFFGPVLNLLKFLLEGLAFLFSLLFNLCIFPFKIIAWFFKEK